MGERAHTANIGRREIRYRPVDFYRERERSEGEEGAGNLPPPAVGRPVEETSVIREAQASRVPKISEYQSWVAIQPWYMRGRDGEQRIVL